MFQLGIYVPGNLYLITLFSRINKFFLLNSVKSSQYSNYEKAERERESECRVFNMMWKVDNMFSDVEELNNYVPN